MGNSNMIPENMALTNGPLSNLSITLCLAGEGLSALTCK